MDKLDSDQLIRIYTIFTHTINPYLYSKVLYNAKFGVYMKLGIRMSLPYFKGSNFQSNDRKMIISWSFTYNYSVKFHGKKMGATTWHAIMRCPFKGLHCQTSRYECVIENYLSLFSSKTYVVVSMRWFF